MNYEEKYKEALAKIQKYTTDEYGCIRLKPSDIFSELSKSEDERIIGKIIEVFKEREGFVWKDGTTNTDIISWLEKQGEKKHTDKTEPKFKAGDWIVQESIGVYKVIEVCESWYEVVDNKDKHYSIGFDREYMCHLWTIQDAEDGDMLAEHETIVLFKKIESQNIRCYCTYHYLGFNPTFYVGTLQNKNPYCPATKEQRDLLFQKMKEAGYEWDADKKELKKIEQKLTAWSEEDEKIGNAIYESIDFTVLKSFGISEDEAVSWLRKDRDNQNSQSKQEWSEEDEKKRKGLIKGLEDRMGFGWASDPFSRKEYIDWLKSLKSQTHWKPSEEQMEALSIAIQCVYAEDIKLLESLYNDLKNL